MKRCSSSRSSRSSLYWRRLCIEPITFDEDGRITEVSMTTQGAGLPLRRGDRIPGWRACEVGGGAFVQQAVVVCGRGEERAAET